MARAYQKTVVRKRQIIDAARRLIITRGSENVTVRALATAVGLTEGALYRHFKSKRDLLSFLVDDIEETLIGDVNAARSGTSSPLRALDVLAEAHLSAIEQRRGISFQVIAEIISLGDKRLNKKVYGTITEYVTRLRELFAEGIKAGEIRGGVDPLAAATLFFSTVQGLVNIWALSNYSFNLQERYQPVWKMFRESIVKPRLKTGIENKGPARWTSAR